MIRSALLVSILILSAGCVENPPVENVISDRLIINNERMKSFDVHISEEDTGTLIHSAQYKSEEINLTRVFESDTDYRVVITVNGSERWNRTIADYEAYELRILPNDNITVLYRSEV